MATYRVLVQEADTANDFAPGKYIAEFENAKNLAYAHYINDIGEAFWTINQDDHKLRGLRPHEGKAHVKILRSDEVVWRGILAEHDADQDDAILYAYGYEHILFHLISKWNHEWKTEKIAGATGRPVNDLWNRVLNLTDSQLAFATTGTLQAPVTTSNGATDITLETYKLYYKRILHALKELVAIAVSDTTNVCYFELAYTTTPTDDAVTFNFWKDNGSDTTARLEYEVNMHSFSDRYVPIFIRNDVKSVGTGARDQLFRSDQVTSAGTFGHNTFGRRMEPIYLSWVRDNAELDRVTRLRAAKALREDVNIYLRAWPDAFTPMHTDAARYGLGDRIKVKIDRGITQIDKMLFVEGQQVIYVNGLEVVQPIVSDRAGSE